MNGKIKIDLEAIEAMLYYWNALKDKEKVAEKFIYDLIEMPGLTAAYEKEFDAESVRRALSAIKNREAFTSWSKKEARFWNNNLWMMEDLTLTDAMVQPLKMLNANDLAGKLFEADGDGAEFEVIFSPLHFDEYLVSGNKLVINFFKVKPENGKAYIGEQELTEFIVEKVKNELYNK